MKNNKPVFKTVLSALFLSLALLLPLITSQIKEIGDTLLPMHLPVLLCGLICGPKYGLAVGFAAPFMRWAIFGMPPIYPNGIYMALELATYGLIVGLLYRKKSVVSLYISVIIAQLAGRIVWGVSKAVLLGLKDLHFTAEMFFIGGFADALPGIILQLILIPAIMVFIERKEIKLY